MDILTHNYPVTDFIKGRIIPPLSFLISTLPYPLPFPTLPLPYPFI